MLLNPHARFPLAAALQTVGAPLGEIYSFISGLYFRGKMAYVDAFGAAPPGLPPAVVITPGAGLLPSDTQITESQLLALAAIDIHADEPRYREPLERDARRLHEATGPDCQFILLGSIATAKYIAPLLDCFGDRLVFPGDFVGRGDMSRGGLMLRCAREGRELTYVPARGAVRHGPRPPRLPKLPR
ncbi:MAG TPA: hypothetical protein VER03_04485 [Bryobacteraceae bacterium]|nr:hypothetical protein [Bryobacteraceae bacterium]